MNVSGCDCVSYGNSLLKCTVHRIQRLVSFKNSPANWVESLCATVSNDGATTNFLWVEKLGLSLGTKCIISHHLTLTTKHCVNLFMFTHFTSFTWTHRQATTSKLLIIINKQNEWNQPPTATPAELHNGKSQHKHTHTHIPSSTQDVRSINSLTLVALSLSLSFSVYAYAIA